VPLLRDSGAEAIAVDLPGADAKAGLDAYADLVCAAATGHDDVVLVAQSLGGCTAALAAQRVPVRAIVFVNAMIPVPGELVGDWWGNTGAAQARIASAKQHGYSPDFDVFTYFLHDVDPAVAAEGEQYQRPEADAVFESVCDFTKWPDVPIHVVAGADDRFFPLEFQQRIARERLGVEPDMLPGGHLLALAHPRVLADYLLAI
jgi:pimeloyl-ACP methyl ester carboxylesterase